MTETENWRLSARKWTDPDNPVKTPEEEDYYLVSNKPSKKMMLPEERERYEFWLDNWYFRQMGLRTLGWKAWQDLRIEMDAEKLSKQSSPVNEPEGNP